MIIDLEWKYFSLLFFIILFFIFFITTKKKTIEANKIIFFSEFSHNQKFFIGQKYKLLIKNYELNKEEKIISINTKNNKVKIINETILMNSSGRECLYIYTKNNNNSICFNIYDYPNLYINKINSIKLEINNFQEITLNCTKLNLSYESNHPDLIKVDREGKIKAMRPGKAIITISQFNNIITKINVTSISNNGLINNYTLFKYNASLYNKVMIVAHPDDEILWGGANLIRDNYFVVCITNGYNFARANDFREILKFTNNSGIILNYPDIQDNIIDDWSEIENGILKDLSTILNYKNWDKIVTHGPDGTTGHYHHKKLNQYVTEITKKYNIYKNLYYFQKFYKKGQIPNYLPRINDSELEYKRKEVEIYKSVKHTIYQLWFHMLPFENFIPASNSK